MPMTPLPIPIPAVAIRVASVVLDATWTASIKKVSLATTVRSSRPMPARPQLGAIAVQVAPIATVKPFRRSADARSRGPPRHGDTDRWPYREVVRPSCRRITVRLDKPKSNMLRPAHHNVAAYVTTRVVPIVDHAFSDYFVDRVAVGAGDTIAWLEIAVSHIPAHHGRALG
jgi:hypothetical protein